MVNEIDKTCPMTVRNTFTAISFHAKGRRRQIVDAIDIVSVRDGKIGDTRSFEFRRKDNDNECSEQPTFSEVFKQVRNLIADRNTPVVGWGVGDGRKLVSLIDAYDIDIECPVRYFNLQEAVRQKMRNERIANDWRKVAKELQVEVTGARCPSAVDCARIHLKLDATDYQLIVARAFLAFIRSIMEDDNRIDTFEAKGLQAFLSVLTSNFEQFNALRKIVDETLVDDVIEDHESALLMRELHSMREKYQTYVDSYNRKELMA